MKKLNRTTASLPLNKPVKVLQFGEGNFLRAFVDWMIDLMNERADFNGAVQLVQPIQQGMGHLVNEQDGLYHVLLNGIVNQKPMQEIRLISCVAGATNPYDDFQGYLKLGENPDLQFVVSNTTEAGIAFNEKDNNLVSLASSFPGKLTQLLYHRFKFFNGSPQKALTVMPCELIDKNGDNLKTTVLQYIALWKLPDDFKKWITNDTSFCNTLVDRIVPGYPKDSISEITSKTGYEDRLVVMAEPFHLWVIEAPDSVPSVFPVQKAGLDVKFVKSLTPYRTRKVSILNGAHTAMVPVAYLSGFRTVRESIEDPGVGNFVRKTLFEEIIPTIDMPEEELHRFADEVIERFRNPFIRHELSSIALNSISKFKVRVLPSVLGYIKIKKKLPDRLLYSLAALIKFYEGEWKGEVLPVSDSPDIMLFFKECWQSAENPEQIVKRVLSNRAFWDQDLTQIEGLSPRVTEYLKQIEGGITLPN